jgi:hypothetical protein
MTELTIIDKLLVEFKSAHSSKGSIAFFRKSPEAYYIFLNIMRSFYSKEQITIEKLINIISPKFCSRQTVKNITNNALEENIIIKKIDTVDKRKKHFTPTQKTIEEFSNWVSKSLKDL